MSKIFILSDQDVLPVLTTFMDIENIPKAYGGKLEWSFFDEPSYDDEIKHLAKWENGFDNFPAGPCIWAPTEDGTQLECLAVGSQNGQERRVRVCTIPKASASKPETTVTTEEKKEEEKPAVPEGTTTVTEPQAPVPRTGDAEDTTVESTADAVAGLVITDAKDSTPNLTEKIADAADAATETKAH